MRIKLYSEKRGVEGQEKKNKSDVRRRSTAEKSQHCSGIQSVWCSMQRQTGGCSVNSRAALAIVAASDKGDKGRRKELAWREAIFQEWARAGVCSRLVVIKTDAVPCAGQA